MEIELQAFRAWLVAQPEGAEVGRACVSELCPLARFLRETYGGVWIVGPGWLGWRADWYTCRGLMMPGWMSYFIVLVDMAVGGSQESISREVALAVLDEVLVKCRR